MAQSVTCTASQRPRAAAPGGQRQVPALREPCQGLVPVSPEPPQFCSQAGHARLGQSHVGFGTSPTHLMLIVLPSYKTWLRPQVGRRCPAGPGGMVRERD